MPRVRPFFFWLRERHRKDIEQTSWRAYTAQSLQALMGGEGASWWDIVHPAHAETRTGDEVAQGVIQRAGIKVGGGDAK